ncbi:MAG: filamentous hemagglutinin N-terminal domain-containing protein, partial [Stigonema ocellatum SAG 48.90 = DSM 106950]|nr:filamentous hemagglutinin N-terminal domain-containing protein [Stigonema ocellatum SAG 48.90 = DSM 106950]
MSGISTRSRWFLGMAMGGAIGSALALSTNCASAQIRPDGTLPNNSTVRLEGNNHIIEGGTRAGGNLFHSFSEFSVPNKETAHFNNAADVQNIFGRVTGGSVSKIDGIIKAMGTANLFLINPNGIIFGKNASLNVGGSFVGTTANAIQFGNLGFFSATNPDASAPMLTINPSALFFNQSTIAAISNSSVAKAGLDPTRAEVTGLRVPDGQSLLLVGGDVNINGGSLRAYGGRVELAGLAAPGTVGLNVGQNILTLSLTEDVQRANVSLSNGAEVNVRAQDSGSIAINAQNVSLTGGSKLRAGIESELGTPQSKAGDIDINATGDTVLSDGSFIANTVVPNAVGQGGNVSISADSLSVTNGAQLNASTLGQGNAGNVIINAAKSVSLDGSGSTIFSNVGAVNNTQNNIVKGNGGNTQITTDQLFLSNGAQLVASTLGQGNAGNVIVNASKSVSLDGKSGIFSSVGAINNTQNNIVKGNGGNIQITTDQLFLSNGAQLQAITFGQGDAGNIEINAKNSVSVKGTDSSSGSSSGLFTSTDFNSTGNGGDLTVNT